MTTANRHYSVESLLRFVGTGRPNVAGPAEQQLVRIACRRRTSLSNCRAIRHGLPEDVWTSDAGKRVVQAWLGSSSDGKLQLALDLPSLRLLSDKEKRATLLPVANSEQQSPKTRVMAIVALLRHLGAEEHEKIIAACCKLLRYRKLFAPNTFGASRHPTLNLTPVLSIVGHAAENGSSSALKALSAVLRNPNVSEHTWREIAEKSPLDLVLRVVLRWKMSRGSWKARERQKYVKGFFDNIRCEKTNADDQDLLFEIVGENSFNLRTRDTALELLWKLRQQSTSSENRWTRGSEDPLLTAALSLYAESEAGDNSASQSVLIAAAQAGIEEAKAVLPRSPQTVAKETAELERTATDPDNPALTRAAAVALLSERGALQVVLELAQDPSSPVNLRDTCIWKLWKSDDTDMSSQAVRIGVEWSKDTGFRSSPERDVRGTLRMLGHAAQSGDSSALAALIAISECSSKKFLLRLAALRVLSNEHRSEYNWENSRWLRDMQSPSQTSSHLLLHQVAPLLPAEVWTLEPGKAALFSLLSGVNKNDWGNNAFVAAKGTTESVGVRRRYLLLAWHLGYLIPR